MTGVQVKRRGQSGSRAGAQALTLLSTPINVAVLDALLEGPKPLVDLRRAAGSSPATTLRGHLKTLTGTEVIERRRQNSFPGSLDYALTPVGIELIAVTKALQTWLDESPEGSLVVGGPSAKSAIKALIEGWGTGMVRALAAKPLSLTELDGLIAHLNYPSLERRLMAMRSAGQIEPAPSSGRGTPYTVTRWLRRAVAPLALATRWERKHVPTRTTPMSRIDAEAAFLLAMPLVRPPAEVSGACRLAVDIQSRNGGRPAGVLVGVQDGQIASCTTIHGGPADAWVSGSAPNWLEAVIGGETERLEMGGDGDLARALIDGLHSALFTLQLR